MTKTLAQRQQEEIEELKQRVVQLQGLLLAATGAASGSTGALLQERAQLINNNEILTEAVRQLQSVMPTVEHAYSQSLVKEENLPVGATIFLGSANKEQIEVIRLNDLVYQGTREQFLENVPRQIQLLLSGIPSPADYGPPPDSIEINELIAIFEDLTYSRLISHDKYLKDRKDVFKRYWQRISNSDLQYSKDKEPVRTAFYIFFDRAFEKQSKRMNSITTPFKLLTKPVRDK